MRRTVAQWGERGHGGEGVPGTPCACSGPALAVSVAASFKCKRFKWRKAGHPFPRLSGSGLVTVWALKSSAYILSPTTARYGSGACLPTAQPASPHMYTRYMVNPLAASRLSPMWQCLAA